MQHVRQRPASATSPSPATATEVAATSNGKKKSILKKSESGSHHHHHHPTLRNAAKAAVTGSGSGDPELENLLVSDPDTSANTTPASVRKPAALSMGNLPPTANHDQLKSLTGPKLRVGVKEQPQQQPQQQQQQHKQQPPVRKPILVNNVQNNNKNNGNVASKEIQTSTANLLALAATAGKTNQ